MSTINFVNVTPQELAEMISTSVKGEFQKELKNIQPSEHDSDWITPEETAKLLNVALSTVWRYRNKGSIIGYNFESKVYYKRSEIEKGFIKID